MLTISPQGINTSVLSLFIYPVSDLVGEIGCYIFDFMQIYGLLVTSTVSFYIALFRYFCIIHPEKMHRWGWAPEVNFA